MEKGVRKMKVESFFGCATRLVVLVTVLIFGGSQAVGQTRLMKVNADGEFNGDLSVDGDVSIDGDLDVQGSTGNGDVATVSNEGTNTDTILIIQNANSDPSSHGAILQGRQSRGSFSQLSQVDEDDCVLSIQGAGYINGAFRPSVEIRMEVDDEPGSEDYPSRITFWTTQNGMTLLRERLRIDDHGFTWVNGPLYLDNITFAASEVDYHGILYAKLDNEVTNVFARNDAGTGNQLSSHKDPRDVDPRADTSFGDDNVDLPFSFHHYNDILGKGSVVDLAAVVAEVERMTGKSFTHVYELPSEQRVTAAEWQDRAHTLRIEAEKEKALREMPEVEVPIADAWEEVEIVEASPTIQSATRFRYDLEAEQVVAYEVPVEVAESVGTGQFERRLKDNVRFDEETGKFYRQRTLEEIDVGPIPEPELPRWIRDRLPGQ